MIGQKKQAQWSIWDQWGQWGFVSDYFWQIFFKLVRSNEPNQPDSTFAQILDPEDQSRPTWLDFGSWGKDHLGFLGFCPRLQQKSKESNTQHRNSLPWGSNPFQNWVKIRLFWVHFCDEPMFEPFLRSTRPPLLGIKTSHYCTLLSGKKCLKILLQDNTGKSLKTTKSTLYFILVCCDEK